jgi:hypothetical protein
MSRSVRILEGVGAMWVYWFVTVLALSCLAWPYILVALML